MKERILITGGCGFIGHHFVEHCLRNTNWDIIIFDTMNYASKGMERLRDISCFDEDRVRLFTPNLGSYALGESLAKEIGKLDYVVHMAAETHVDKSIEDPRPFVISNILGTMEMLEFCRKFYPELKKFLYFSTDEVFGPAPEGINYKEWDRYNSTNPYSATKASGEELCLAWSNTYGMNVVITHTMNVFGERQFGEKFIPMCVKKIMAGEKVTIHSNKDKTKAGSRFYIHARNVANAVQFLLKHGEKREKYNIVGEKEVSNLELAELIAKQLNKPLKYELVDFHSSRPGHDLRYALDGSKMAGMGWKVPKTFEESLSKTIQWTLDNPRWL